MLKLYAYWRSSASYRVRIALNLKGLAYEISPVHLLKDGGQQHQAAYRALNPEGRVPLLVDGDFKLGQSLAIFGYLESQYPTPALLPADVRERARVWQFCEAINADIQPLQNLGPLGYLSNTLGVSDEQKTAWIRHWIDRGLSALEQEISDLPERAALFGDTPGYADCCLVPQLYAARRFGADLARYPRLVSTSEGLEKLPAFAAAHPEQQPDANA
ncbi:MAG: maleylacetoacetate isomerase [Pseudomonadota bacterium]